MAENVVEVLEAQLNDFNPKIRADSLRQLHAHLEKGDIELEQRRGWVNLHCHSFCSYNGYSPSRIVWMAKKTGLDVIGLVDFDILDGVDEFYAAGRLLQVRTVAGMETRAYIPEFADKEINSPGELGIAYHMGTAFPCGHISAKQRAFAEDLCQRARARNESMIEKINILTSPVKLRYKQDLLPLTPTGNVTERHICQAYETKALALFPHDDKRAKFWCDRLGGEESDYKSMDSVSLQALIRGKTMKSGGVGYQQPDAGTFPLLCDVNAFVAALGAVPTLTWLDGTRDGEAVEVLLDLHQEAGSHAISIVPDRNWNIQDPDQKKQKLENLYEIVEHADKRGLPIQIGTRMNAPGLKFVDDFDAEELAPVKDSFERGAFILYGHVLEKNLTGNGYVGTWADQQFASVFEKNVYFEKIGRESICLPTIAGVSGSSS